MSVDIYDFVRAEIRQKLDTDGMYEPEDNFDGYAWESENHKKTEDALSDVLSGTEEGNYRDGMDAEFKRLLDEYSDRVVEMVKARRLENEANSFDPMI